VPAIKFHIRRIAMARRAVRELTAIAERPAATAARKRRAGVKFRALSEPEAEALVGTDLLAAVAAGTMSSLHSTNIDSHGADP
jgi:hypothetical protein